ncbi:MAG: thioredoxin domain-containing protein [Nitrospinae bacterium]|nr:thioredoxin domain-containing protein [Nitrospinota bacterium]
MPRNRLNKAISPYLLKHAANPVHWQEWGEQALSRARGEDKLIFLSIGYTACHWCNELEKECFSQPDFAEVINARYVSVKVDREERPDLDHIYMQASLALNGSGGWPNNVILTPDLHPIFSLGYRPREVFKRLLTDVAAYWARHRAETMDMATRLTGALRQHMEGAGRNQPAARHDRGAIRDAMDTRFGGFGEATKFPMTAALEFLLAEGGDDDFVRLTLDAMAYGGMYDRVGGGFHRYSVDAHWEVPHFEKMLYDNALLAPLYARASLAYKSAEYARVARETLAFIERELMNAGGGFESSLDADTAQGEGVYYTWTRGEVERVTGGAAFADDYGVSARGNVHDIAVTAKGNELIPTGRNTLRRLTGRRHEDSLRKLREVRARRDPPPKDDKVVAAWSAMAVSAFARSGVALGDPALLARAVAGGEFLLNSLGLARLWRKGRASGEAMLEDAAFAAMAFWDLFEATGQGRWLDACATRADYAHGRFAAGDGGYYQISAKAARGLIARPRSVEDNPLPSAAAVLGRVEWRLGEALGEGVRIKRARAIAEALLARLGIGLLSMEALSLRREADRPAVEVVYAFAPGEADTFGWMRAGHARGWGVIRMILGAKNLSPSLSEGRWPAARTTAYVCHDGVCRAPALSPAETAQRIAETMRANGMGA